MGVSEISVIYIYIYIYLTIVLVLAKELMVNYKFTQRI